MDDLKELTGALQAHFSEEAVSSRRIGGRDVVYAETWAYQDRLDEIFGLAWHSSIDWPDIPTRNARCVLTVWVGDEAYTREAYGEPEMRSTPDGPAPIFGTAEAQAFKRACVAFGIGRYLYHYEGPVPESGNSPPRRNGAPPASSGAGDERTQKQADYLDSLGSRLYGTDWRAVRNERVAALTGGDRPLSSREASGLIEEFKAALENPGPPAGQETKSVGSAAEVNPFLDDGWGGAG